MRSPRVARLALLWLVAISWPHAPAYAQVGESRAPRDQARALFEHGVSAARAGHWEEAREDFSRSHALVPSAITLLNLAGSQVNTGRLVEGHATYRMLLKSPGEAAAHVGDIERVVRELETRLPMLRFTPGERAPGQRLALDGKELPPGDGSAGMHVNPGEHAIELGRAGEPPVRHEFSIAEGQTLVLDLEALCARCAAGRALSGPAAEPAQELDAPRTHEPVAAEPGEHRHLRTLALTSFVVAGAGLVTLAVTGPLALKENRELAKGCGEGKSCSAAEVERADRLALGADVGLGVLLGSAVVGTVAWLVSGKRGEAKHSLRVAPSVARSHLGLTTQVSF